MVRGGFTISKNMFDSSPMIDSGAMHALAYTIDGKGQVELSEQNILELQQYYNREWDNENDHYQKDGVHGLNSWVWRLFWH